MKQELIKTKDITIFEKRTELRRFHCSQSCQTFPKNFIIYHGDFKILGRKTTPAEGQTGVRYQKVNKLSNKGVITRSNYYYN